MGKNPSSCRLNHKVEFVAYSDFVIRQIPLRQREHSTQFGWPDNLRDTKVDVMDDFLLPNEMLR
jgi:hypothetical protein